MWKGCGIVGKYERYVYDAVHDKDNYNNRKKH